MRGGELYMDDQGQTPQGGSTPPAGSDQGQGGSQMPSGDQGGMGGGTPMPPAAEPEVPAGNGPQGPDGTGQTV